MFSPEFFEGKIPSERLSLLHKLKGSRVTKLVRYSWFSPNATPEENYGVSKENAKDYEIIPISAFFRMTPGPILITLESGLVIGFGSNPGLCSVTVWVDVTEQGERDEKISVIDDKELYPIDACDPVYSEEPICQLRGKKIVIIKVLQRETDSSRMQERPREYGVVLEFENGSELVMSHGLHDNSDTFSVIFRSQIQADIVKDLREMIVI